MWKLRFISALISPPLTVFLSRLQLCHFDEERCAQTFCVTPVKLDYRSCSNSTYSERQNQLFVEPPLWNRPLVCFYVCFLIIIFYEPASAAFFYGRYYWFSCILGPTLSDLTGLAGCREGWRPLLTAESSASAELSVTSQLIPGGCLTRCWQGCDLPIKFISSSVSALQAFPKEHRRSSSTCRINDVHVHGLDCLALKRPHRCQLKWNEKKSKWCHDTVYFLSSLHLPSYNDVLNGL